MRSTQSGLVRSIILCAAALLLPEQAAFAQPAKPWTQCPHIGGATSCGVLIVINANNTVSVYVDSSQVSPGYGDGEDTLTGVLNNSSKTIASLPLTSTTDIFGFDVDGICDSSINPRPAGCPFGSTGYEGPGVSFSNISADQRSGTVNFTPGLAPGGSAYFALEEALSVSQLTIPLNTSCPANTAIIGQAYSSQLVGTGGNGTYTWSLAGGSLGQLTLNASGLVSGAPTSAASLSFTLRITDSTGATATQQCGITISTTAGGGVSVTAGPVMSTISQGVCGISAPPAKSAFLTSDPNITYWVSLSGVNVGDLIRLTYSGPGGASYSGQVTAQWAALWVCWTLPASPANAPVGNWSISATRNSQSIQAATTQFTLSGPGGSGGGGKPTSGQAGGGGGVSGVSLTGGPVFTESVPDPLGNCPSAPPSAIGSFGANDPIVTIWIQLGPLTAQNTVLTRFAYNGVAQTSLDLVWSFSGSGNIALCPSFLPNGTGIGSWTLTAYLNGQLSSPIVTIPFTLNSGTGGGPGGVTVTGSPVMSTINQSACSALSPSPVKTNFLTSDPNITYWVSLSGVTVGDNISLTYAGPGGTSYTGQVSAQWPALWVCWTLPVSPANTPVGNWTVSVSRNNQSIQAATTQFTVSSSGGSGGGTQPASGQAPGSSGGGGGSCGSPITTSLVLCLDASNGLSINGSNWTWNDLSGLGHNGTGSGTPSLTLGSINGRTAAKFDGNEKVVLAGQVLTSQQFTIIAVATNPPGGGQYQEIISNASAPGQVFLGTVVSSGVKVRFTDSVGGANDNSQGGRGAISQPSSPFILGGIANGSNLSIYLGSSLLYQTPSAPPAFPLGGPYAVGVSPCCNDFWNGMIGEVLVFNSALSPSDFNSAVTYLTNKWLGGSGGGGGSCGSPITTSLVLCLDASNGLAADGSTWSDLSGQGHNATALQGQAPTVVPSAIKGLTAAQFKGNQALSIAGQVLTSQQFTVMAVVTDATSAPASHRDVFSNWNGGTSGVFLGDTGFSPDRVRFSDYIGGLFQGQTGQGTLVNATSPFILSGIASANASIYQNSNVLYQLGSAIPNLVLANPYYIGRQGTQGVEYWNGFIGEVLVFNSALSPADFNSVVTYLTNKWLAGSSGGGGGTCGTTGISAGLIGCWQLDGNYTDGSGNGRDLTPRGNVSFGPGINAGADQALVLPGDPNAYAARSANDSVFDFTSGDFSIQAWFKTASLAGNQSIIEKPGSAGGGGGWYLSISNGTINFLSGAGFVQGAGALAGAWNQVVVTRQGGTITLYINGTAKGTISGGSFISSVNNLYIGVNLSASGFTQPLSGSVDQLAIWNRALSPGEITQLNGSGGALGSGGPGGGGGCGTTALTSYDVTANWSTVNNPNCPWTYQEDSGPLPRQANWTAAGGIWSSCPEPAWATGNTAGSYLPALMQMTSCTAQALNALNGSVQTGDIVVHTNDNTNGNTTLGPANILFTVPASGTWTISGSVWNARLDSARPQDWQLSVNDTVPASGTLNGTVARSQAVTFNVTRTLNAGDTTHLILTKNASASFGNFVGVTMTVTQGSGGGTGSPPVTTSPGCSYNVQPADGPGGQPPAFPRESPALNVEFTLVFSQAGCKFAAYSPVDWVHVTPTALTAVGGAQNQGSATLQIDAQPAGGAQRQTIVTVADKQVTVIQLANSALSPCTYTLSSTSSTPFAYQGGSGSLSVTVAGGGCLVQASIDPASSVPAQSQWAQISSATTFSTAGTKTILYQVNYNNTTSARSIKLIVTGTNPSATLTFTINQAAGPANTNPPPTIGAGGITNSASFITGGPIAQGSFFSIFGTNMGPPNPGVKAASYPLQTVLAGVSVSVSDGKGTTVQALPVFVAEFQINAIMPSNAPLGDVQITATFNGITGPPQHATVVTSAFGAFAVSLGRGPGIVQNAKPDGSRPLNTTLTTVAPTGYVVVWGTGLGPLSLSLTCAGATVPDQCDPNTNFVPQVSSVQVFVGGVQVNLQDQFAYAARAPDIAGVDQVQFPLPANVPLGCYVAVQVVVNGNLYSNTVTMAINTSGLPCVDDNPLSRLPRDGGKNGFVLLARVSATGAKDPTFNGSIDLGVGEFLQQPAGGPLGFDVFGSTPPVGTCTYYNNIDLGGLLGGQLPTVPGSSFVDAGAVLTVKGSNGTQPMIRPDSTSPYVGLLGGPLSLSSKPFLDPGAFTVSGAGGKDVGAFSFNINVGAPATLVTQVTTIPRSQPLVLNWSGGNGSNQNILILGYAQDPDKKATGAFECLVSANTTTFTVPAGMLANLPTTITAGGNASGALLFLTTPTGNQFVTFTSSSPALDRGVAMYMTGEARQVAFQ